MYRFEDVSLRRFTEEDIPNKVDWVNNPENNKYLHYDLPLTVEKTKLWYDSAKNREDRWDATALYYGKPVGVFGLLNIDYVRSQAEYYSLLGETSLRGKGIGSKACLLNIAHAFYDLNLNKVWGTIEAGNEPSLHSIRHIGGIVEGYLHDHIYRDGRFVDAYYVAIFKDTFILPKDVFKED